MRIGINGRFLVAKQTGVQRAAYNLVKTLFELDRTNEYFLFTGRSQLDNPEWSYANVHVIASSLKEGENFRNHLWEQFSLPRMAKKYKVDILHSPANMAPLLYKGKSIVHIHDLCFVVNPQWYSYTFHRVYNFIIPRLAKKSSMVITNSNNSRNDLLQFCDLSSEKVKLIYWAVDDTFHQAPNKTVMSHIEEDNYILYVGSLEPRKNISTLVKAYEQMRAENPGLKTKLVLIGGKSPLFANDQLKITSFKNEIIFKGFVSDDMLRAYYCKAEVVAYPSLYEGFGLPPLEAMACGAPVVTSNTSSIPEVVGDAAILVSPYEAGQLALVLAKVLASPSLRESMREKGWTQVRKFNWYRVARNILSAYYEVYHGTKGRIDDSDFGIEAWRELVKKEKYFLRQRKVPRAQIKY